MKKEQEVIRPGQFIEKRDADEFNLRGVDMTAISTTDADLYMQVADIRRKIEAGADIKNFAEKINLLDDLTKRIWAKKFVAVMDESRKNFGGFLANKLGELRGLLQAAEKGVKPHEPRGMDFLEEEDKKNHHIVLMLEKDKDALTKLSDEDRKLYRKMADLREEVVEGNYADEDVVKEIDAAIKELDALRIKEKDSLFLGLIANQLTIVQLTANSILEDEK